MKTELNEFIKSEYQDKQNLARVEAVTKFANDFDSTVNTVYRWIKGGKHYVINGELFEKVK